MPSRESRHQRAWMRDPFLFTLALTLWGPLIDERLAMKERVADANVASRQALWSAAVRMSADHPLVGVGPGQFGPRSADFLDQHAFVLVERRARSLARSGQACRCH